MAPLLYFIAGGLAALSTKSYVKKAAKKALRSAVESVEEAQRELDEDNRAVKNGEDTKSSKDGARPPTR